MNVIVQASQSILGEKALPEGRGEELSKQVIPPESPRETRPHSGSEIASLGIDVQIEASSPIAEPTGIESNEDFYNKCASILDKKEIAVSTDFQKSLDRRMPIDKVRKRWGEKLARAFAVTRGLVTENKGEQLVYKESSAEKFQEYDTKAKLVGESEFSVDSSYKNIAKSEIFMDPLKGSVDVVTAGREKDSDALYLTELLGELGLYVLSKVRDRKDDGGKEVTFEVPQMDKFPLKKLGRMSITNDETVNTVLLLLEDEFQEFQKQKVKKGIININKDTEKGRENFLGIVGTPNGYATLFLPKQYKFVFGDKPATRIEVQFSGLPLDIPINEIKPSDIEIDEIRFYYDEI